MYSSVPAAERRNPMVTITAFYSGDSGIECRSEDRKSWLWFVILLSTLRNMLEDNLKLGHDCLFSQTA
jgi:hypothetical protein